MEKPKCKLCGERHWSGDGCAAAPPRTPLYVPPVMLEAARDAAPTMDIRPVPTLPVPAPTKFDKVAYQREYMRKRRAAAKQEKA